MSGTHRGSGKVMISSLNSENISPPGKYAFFFKKKSSI